MAKSLIPGADDWKKKRGIKTESETPSLKINGKETSEVAKEVTAKHSAPQKKTAAQSTAERSLPNIKYNFTGARTQQKSRSLFGDVTGADFAKSGLRRVTDYATAKTRADYDENLRRIGLTRNADKDKLRREAYRLFEQQSRYDMYDFDIQNLSNVSQKLRAFKITKENLKEYEKLKKEYEQANARFNVAMAAKQQARERLLRKQEKEADKELKASVTEYLKQSGRFTAEPQKKESPYKSVEVGNKYFDRLMKNFSNDNPLSRINEAQAQADYLERDYKRRADEITKERTALESEYERLLAGNGTPGEIESFNKRVSDFNRKAAKLERDAVLYNGKIKDINENFRTAANSYSRREKEKNRANALTDFIEQSYRERKERAKTNPSESQKLIMSISNGMQMADPNKFGLPVGDFTDSVTELALRRFTREEKEVYYSTLSTQPDMAEDYFNKILKKHEEEIWSERTKAFEAFAAHGIGGKIGAVALNSLYSMPKTAEDIVYTAKRASGNDMDRNLSKVSESLRRGAARDVKSGFGQLLLDAGFSTGEMLATFLFSGGIGSLASSVAGANAAAKGTRYGSYFIRSMADSMDEVLQRGGTEDQAWTLGILNGAAEVLAECLGTEKWFALLGKPRGTVSRVIKEAVKRAGSEFTEEALTEVAQRISDGFVMGEESEYSAYIRELMKAGLTEAEANAEAFKEFFIKNPLKAGATGAISAAMTGAGADIRNAAQIYGTGKQISNSPEAMKGLKEAAEDVLKQNYMGRNAEYSKGLQKDISNALEASANAKGKFGAAWNAGKARAGLAELYNTPKLSINSDTVFSDLRNEERNGAAQNKNNKWTSERIAQLDNAVKKSGVNIIIEDIPQAEVEDNKVRQGAYYRNANTIVIDPRVSDVQIANTVLFHELAHSTEGTKYYDEFKNYIKGIKGEEFITETEKKMKSLRLSREEAESEAVADFVKDIFRGGTEEMNGFLARNYTAAREITDTMKNIIDSVKIRFGVEPSSVYERAVRSFEKALAKRETGGEEKAQNKIEYLKDGRSYVTPDREAIFTNNPEKWGEELEAYINDEIRHGRDVKLLADNGDVLNITEDTAWKVGDMNGWNEKTFPIKMNMGTHIDELAEISKPNNVKDAGDRSDKRFQPDKFEHRTAYFRDYDNKYYRVHLSVGIDENGKTVYSIGNDIKEQEFPQANGSGSAAKVQRQSRSEGDGLSGATLNTIIRDADGKYNSNFNQDYQGKNVKNSTGEVSAEEKARLIKEDRITEEGKSVKQQLEENADKLNSMEPVFVRNDIYVQRGNRGDNLNWILQELGSKDIRVQREGVGEIILDSKRISNSLRYLKSDGELAAYAALPDVLEKGTIIDVTDNHKGRNYSTLTIGAPVVINEVRGNVAAVIKQDSGKNVYKVHRILLPDGSSFVYKNNESSAERAEVNTQNVPTRTPAVTAFNNSILENGEKYNSNFNQEYRDENVKNSTGEVSAEEKARLIKEDREKRNIERYGEEAGKVINSLERNLKEARRQLTPTTEAAVRESDVRALADDYIKSGVDMGKDELAGRLAELYNKMLYGNEKITGAEAYAEARTIATDMIKKTADVYFESELRDFRKEVKSFKLTISKEDAKDIADWGEWKKEQGSALHVVLQKEGVEGTPVDSAYTELAERFPYLLSGDAAAPSDMLFEIADAVKETQRYTTDFGMDPKEYRNALAEDILENFFGVRQTAPTAADKFQKRLESRDRKIRELRADRDAKLEALKEKKNARIEKILEREKEFREMTAEQRITARESRRKNEEIASIRRVYNILARKTVKPTDKSHHVHGIEGAVADFLSLIDLTSTKSKDTGKAHEKISALREKIFEAANNISGPYGELIDPDLQRNIEYLREAIENKHIDEYTRKERQTLLKVLYAIWKFDTNADATLSERLDRKISDLGRLVIDENQVKKGKEYSVKNRQMKRVESFFRTDMLDSLRFFKRLGPTMSMLYEGLTEGRDDYIRKYDSGVQYYQKVMKEFLEDTGDKGRIYGAYKRLSREASKIKLLSGDTIYVTKAQAMSLYELNKREQAREHIYKGGLRFTEQEKASTEKKGEKYRVTAENYYVTPEDVYNITNILTPKEKALADRLTRFFGETAKWGNAVSLKLYGYEKFRERNYFPIEVNKNVLYSDPTQSGEALTKNMGAAKSTVDKASNAINLRNIFDVYADTVNNMANYGSMVLPIEDIRRVWNYKSKDRNGEVKTNLENKFGTSVLSYFDDFIRDIGRGITTPRGDGLANLLLSKAKGAAVGLNISVAVQQPLSIIRASTAISPKYLMRGALMKGDYELIKKYAPIAIWKQYGFFDVDTKPYASMDIFNDRTTLSDIEGFMSQAGDEAAWKAMWNAAVLETAAKNKNMVEKGKVKPEFQEKFYNIAGKRFTQIIDETQVVDTVFNRTGLMRSKSFGAKTATAFMSEPAKEYNVFAGKLMDFAQADNKKAARTALACAAVCLVISKLATNAVKSLVGALRDDKKEKYKEKYIAKLKDNLQGEVFGSIPYLSTLQNIISGYGAENMAWSNIADFVESLKAVGVIKDEYNDGTNKSKINAWADVASTLASVFGRPTKTVKRDLISVAMVIGRAAGSKGNHEFEYSVSKLFYDPASNATKNKDIFFGILNDAVNDEDNEAIDSISKDLGKYNDIYLQNAAMKAYYRKERLPYEDKAKEFDKQYDGAEVKTGKRLEKSYYSYLGNMEKNFFGAARLSSAEQKKEAAGLYKEMINAPRSVNATVDNEVNRLLDANEDFKVSPYYTVKGTVDEDGITRQLSPKSYLEMQKEAIDRIYAAYEKAISSEGYAKLENDEKKAAALKKIREAAADRVSYEAFIKDGADFLKKLMTGEDMTLYKSRNNTKTAAKYLEAMEPFTGGTLESNTALYAYKNADSYMNYMEKHSLLTAEAAQKMNEYAIKRSKAVTRGDAARFGKVNETAYLFDAESIFEWTVNGNEFGIEPTPEQAYNAYILFDKDLDTALQRAYANGFYTAKGSRATYTDKYGNKQPAVWQQMPPDKLTKKIGDEKTRIKEKIRDSMKNSGKVNWYETMPDGTIVRHR